MKNQLSLLLSLLLLGACGSGSRPAVTQLQSDWQKWSTATDQYGTDLTAAYLRVKTLRDTMALPPGSLQRLPTERRAEVQTLLRQMQDYEHNLVDLGREYTDFVQQWRSKTERLDQLTLAVKNRQKLAYAAIPAEIASLQAEGNATQKQLQNWNARLTDLNSKLEATYTQFTQQIAAIQ